MLWLTWADLNTQGKADNVICSQMILVLHVVMWSDEHLQGEAW